MATLRQILGEDHPHIRKLTLSMALAQATKKVEQKLPLQYTQYAKVFNTPGEGELPPWQPFNHGIDLKETFVPKVAKSYPMNPKEMEACKAFIDKHLKSGKIRKSQSPQASLFFFIQKKDRDFVLARTIYISTSIQSRMLTHSPSSPPSSISWREPNTSQKWIFSGGITTFTSKRGVNGRPHSPPLLAFMNPWSCSLDNATPHQPSKHSWTLPLETWLWKDGQSST